MVESDALHWDLNRACLEPSSVVGPRIEWHPLFDEFRGGSQHGRWG